MTTSPVSQIPPTTLGEQADDISLKVLMGAQILPHVRSLVDLNQIVYQEPPYLYSANDEDDVLWFQNYAQSSEAIACLLWEGSRLVGAATGGPLKIMPEKFQKPFSDRLDTMFYLGEAILLKNYRGKNWSEQLLIAFEKAIPSSFTTLCFCKINDPNNPSFDENLKKHGFTEHKDLIVEGIWQKIGEEKETSQPMIFWTYDRTL